MKTYALLAVVMLSGFGAGVAQAREKVDQADPDKKVCKQMQVVGSRLPARVCHTSEEWEQIELAARNRMRELDSQRIQVRAEGGGGAMPGG